MQSDKKPLNKTMKPVDIQRRLHKLIFQLKLRYTYILVGRFKMYAKGDGSNAKINSSSNYFFPTPFEKRLFPFERIPFLCLVLSEVE